MAQNNYTIEIKIWDSWEVDTYTMNGYRFYSIIEIGNKLYFMERYLNEL
jgi:hypothetical protein